MAPTPGFVTAVDPGGTKRLVPEHYLENEALKEQGFKLPPSARKKAARVEEPAASATTTTVTEPAQPDDKEEARS